MLVLPRESPEGKAFPGVSTGIPVPARLVTPLSGPVSRTRSISMGIRCAYPDPKDWSQLSIFFPVPMKNSICVNLEDLRSLADSVVMRYHKIKSVGVL